MFMSTQSQPFHDERGDICSVYKINVIKYATSLGVPLAEKVNYLTL